MIEDDPSTASFLQRALRQEAYQVHVASDGVQGLAAAQSVAPDVVVLDVMLPGIDGLEVARRLRTDGDVAILMLTARDATLDCVEGLDAGADDYLAKPFALEELLARLRALLRRRGVSSSPRDDGALRFADVMVMPDAREATRGGRRLELRRKEFELLVFFLEHPGRVLPRRKIFESVWGSDFLGDSNVIEVTVTHLRQKLEASGEPRLIHTVWGVGYILRNPPASP